MLGEQVHKIFMTQFSVRRVENSFMYTTGAIVYTVELSENSNVYTPDAISGYSRGM